MKKSRLFKLCAAFLALIMSFAVVTGCGGGGDGLSNDPLTINVKIRKAGYGVTYIDKLAQAFETAFAEEGYKVNVLAPREDLLSDNIYREIYSAKQGGGVDVYFGSDITAEKAVNNPDYGQLFADITESVYNKKPINAQGEEETMTVAQKLSQFDTSPCVYNQKVYGLPFALSVGGFAVNTAILSDYDFETPRTTKELFMQADEIMKDAYETDVFPFTFSLSGNDYTLSTLPTWFAQYGGYEEFTSFWSFEKQDSTKMSNAEIAQVFGTDAVQVALQTAFHFFDSTMEAYNSATQSYSMAQNQIMRGTAVFMSNGSWMLNEEFERNKNYIGNVSFINAPMVSELGVLLFGAGTSYNFNDDKCDQVLSTIIKYCDQGLLASQVKTAVDQELSLNLNIDDVTTVCERRGYVKGGTSMGLVISQKSGKKEIAEKFLRFCASEDGARIFAQESRTNSPYAPTINPNTNYAWCNNVNSTISNPYLKYLRIDATGYRERMGLDTMFPSLGSPIANKLQGKVSKYDPDTLEIIATDEVFKQKAAQAVLNAVTEATNNLTSGIWKEIIK